MPMSLTSLNIEFWRLQRPGRTLWLDYDLDGCLDLDVATDFSPSLLYHNDCKGRFSEVGVETGAAFSADG
jgi:hypothetical protein